MDYYIANRWEVAEAVLGISPHFNIHKYVKDTKVGCTTLRSPPTPAGWPPSPRTEPGRSTTQTSSTTRKRN